MCACMCVNVWCFNELKSYGQQARCEIKKKTKPAGTLVLCTVLLNGKELSSLKSHTACVVSDCVYVCAHVHIMTVCPITWLLFTSAHSPMTWEIVYTVMCGLAYVS